MAARSRYRLGRRLEWRIRKILEEHGYEVIRSAGSKGKWDLIAIKPGCVRLIQVKKGKVQKHKIKDLFPLVADLCMVLKEAWFYVGRGKIKVVRNDGMDWSKLLIDDVEEVFADGSRKDNR